MRRTFYAFLISALALACDGYGTTATGPRARGPLPSTFTSVTIVPSTVTLAVGGTTQLTATARDQNGATISVGEPVFSSLNTSVATVSATGFVVGVTAGTTTVTGTITSGTVTRSASVSVVVQ
jgi:glucosylceramidase